MTVIPITQGRRFETVTDNGDGTVTRRRYIDGRLTEKRIEHEPGSPVFHRSPLQCAARVHRVEPCATCG